MPHDDAPPIPAKKLNGMLITRAHGQLITSTEIARARAKPTLLPTASQMTAVTTAASGIAFGAYDVVIAGGVEHMGRHPMGEGVDPNPRILAEKLVDPSALVMGVTCSPSLMPRTLTP